MTASHLAKKRAVAPEDKSERRAAIVRAAAALSSQDVLVSMETLARKSGLAKGTSNVYILALPELFYTIQVIYRRNLEVIPLLMVATVWYLIILTGLSLIQRQVERHFARGALRNPPPSWLSSLAGRRHAPSEVPAVAERFKATPFDIDGAFWSDRGEKCTFDVMVEEFGLRFDALDRLARIVRGADTGCLDLARHFISNDAAKAIASQKIGSMRLE